VRPTVDQSHCYRRDPWGLSAGLPTQAFAQIATPAPPIPELLRVTRTDDNGEGSLRWAIERNGANWPISTAFTRLRRGLTKKIADKNWRTLSHEDTRGDLPLTEGSFRQTGR